MMVLLRACLAVAALSIAFAAPAVANPGQLDTSFGDRGKITSDFNGGVDEANTVAIDSQGRIVVAGQAEAPLPHDPAVELLAISRYLPNGNPDTSFGGGDGQVTAAAAGYSNVRSVAVDDEDRILVGGYHTDEFLPTGIVARFTSGGEIDTTFGRAGFVGFDFASGGQVNPGLSSVAELQVAPDGRIYVGGYINHYEDVLPSPAEMAVTRLHEDGSTDKTYAGDGFARPWKSGKFNRLNAMDVLPSGQIIVAGSTGRFRLRVAVARLKADGSIDRRFGYGGEAKLFSGKAVGNAFSVGADRHGKVVVAGCRGYGTQEHSLERGFMVARLTTEGRPDHNFAKEGIKKVSFGHGYRCASSALLPGGKIIAGGYAASTPHSRKAEDFALARLTKHGKLDKGFGRKGKVKTDFGGGGDEIHQLTFAPGGTILAAGVAHDGGESDFGLAAYQR